MYKFPIGIILDSFRKPFPEALDITRSLGAQGVQVYATRGEMSPENLTGQKRRDFLNAVKDRGLVISALCGDLGHGFHNPEENPQLIERSKRILDLERISSKISPRRFSSSNLEAVRISLIMSKAKPTFS